MQAVILAAGKSSRFFPFNTNRHKSLLPVLGKPIILHTIESVVRAGIKEIIIVVYPNSEIEKILGDGSRLGVEITYVVQDEPTGAGNGLLLAQKNILGDFFLLNVARIDFDEFSSSLLQKKKEGVGAVLLGKKQSGLSNYGMLKVDGDKVLDLLEKPTGVGLSGLRLVGVYLFSLDFLKYLESTPDEHYSLEAAIANYAKNEIVKVVTTDKPVPSLKYVWDLLELKDSLFSRMKGRKISKKAKISKSSLISGDVYIEDGAVVMDGVKIKGPSYVGKNAVIGDNAILRAGSDIEEGSIVGANMEIKNSLILGRSKVHSGYLGDSIMGEDVKIGANFTTANKRIDRKSIPIITEDGKTVETVHVSLGVAIGNGARIGIGVSTMPGVMIGEGSVVGPGTTVLKNVPHNTKYYTKFKETIVKKMTHSTSSGSY